MPKFLSDEWFAKVDELTKAAAGLEIPKGMKDVVVNLTVSTGGGDVPFCMNGGIIQKGLAATADVEMSMPAEYALSIMIKGDWSAGMKGWVARKIKVSALRRAPMRFRMDEEETERITTSGWATRASTVIGREIREAIPSGASKASCLGTSSPTTTEKYVRLTTVTVSARPVA